MAFTVRSATTDDLEVLVRHRIQMFVDMGGVVDETMIATEFTKWLQQHLSSRTYRAWLVLDGDIVAGGGGATVIPWPPGPRYPGHRLAFVYNVYTEPRYRRQGVARLVMKVIQDWCLAEGVTSVALNASADGRRLYESLGYVVTPSPMMFLSLSGYNPTA
jgi:GNAT superfamily N-acetyltransferase